ncbi:MAG TPA: M90 family metallopeptidase [Desulfuromonadaceae bacterium]
MFAFFRRRERIKRHPFPAAWLELLERNVPLYRRLPEADREELRGHIQLFLAEKRFEGCNGLEMSDEVAVTIAGHACLLLLHREGGRFPAISSILVYPDEYIAPWRDTDESGIVVEGEECRSGEYAPEGSLVLSWQDVLMAGVDEEGAYNVIIHEFAHQVDDEYGVSAGRGDGELRRALERGFHRLQRDAAHRRPSLFDPYGAESMAEFFAVATECFFESPRPFRRQHPELYAAMGRFFCQDPAAWQEGNDDAGSG